MERAGEGEGKMERYCSTGQSPQWAVAPMEEEEEEYNPYPLLLKITGHCSRCNTFDL